MKNIQVIDSAENCTFSIFQATDVEFAMIFPQSGQDIQFSEDLSPSALSAIGAIWERPVPKPQAQGIHGTLFYGFERKRRYFPATNREADWSPSAINQAQRRMHQQL